MTNPFAITPSLAGIGPETPVPAARVDALREAAVALEESFLAEMLRLSGVGKPPQVGGGGPGEDAFAGFLADAYAAELSRTGGIGLSEQIFASLLAREDGAVALDQEGGQ